MNLIQQAVGTGEQTTGAPAETTDSAVSKRVELETRRAATRQAALRLGLRAGLVLVALNLLNWLAGLAAGGVLADAVAGVFVAPTIRDVAFLVGGLLFVARLLLFCWVGARAAKRAGLVERGALAGMVAGVVDGVGGLIATLLGVALFPMYTLTAGYTTDARTVGTALLLALAALVALGAVGYVLGGIGGSTLESDSIGRPV